MIAARHISDWWRRLVDNWRRRRDELQVAIEEDPDNSHAWLWSARVRVLDYMLSRYGGVGDRPSPREPVNDGAQIHGLANGPPAKSRDQLRSALRRIADRTPEKPDFQPRKSDLLIPRNTRTWQIYVKLQRIGAYFYAGAVATLPIGALGIAIAIVVDGHDPAFLRIVGGILVELAIALALMGWILRGTAVWIAECAQVKHLRELEQQESLESPDE